MIYADEVRVPELSQTNVGITCGVESLARATCGT